MKTLGSTVKFAIFTVVTLLATALLANTIANTDSRPTSSYGAIFVDAVNLNPGDEVRLAGVRVGSVSAVQLYGGTKAKVTFGVDRAVPLSTTTQAVIRYRNLIGQRYLAIVDGPTSGAPLKPGAVIPEDRTQPALNLNTLFNGFRPLLAGLEPGDVNQLSYELIQVFQGEGGTLEGLLAHTASVTSTLADRDHSCPSCGLTADRDLISAALAACVTLTDPADPRTASINPQMSAALARRIRKAGIDTSHFTGQAHNRGKQSPRRRDPREVLVVLPPGSDRPKTRHLRAAMTYLGVPQVCALCDCGPEWRGAPLTLMIDHINGDWLDNRPENLRFLCPNCHSQTSTWCRQYSARQAA